MRERRKRRQKVSYPLSDHYNGSHFFNPEIDFKKSLKSLLIFLSEIRHRKGWPRRVRNIAVPKFAKNLTLSQAYVTYINHSCHLVQLRDLNILTDPIFSKRAGPLSLLGPKRVRDPGIILKKLPQIHAVVVSHNHYDHMDLPTLKKLEKLFHPLFLVPLGNRKYLKRMKNVIELDWWQTHPLNEKQSITLVPAQHWSLRKLGDANKALWGGYWIQSGALKVYFAGDTGYGPHFKMINDRLGTPDISILPIGAYEPRWFMKLVHMNPDEAVVASLDLKSRLSIATHHQTFRLAMEGMFDPLFNLRESMSKYGVKEEHFLTPENGETIIYEAD